MKLLSARSKWLREPALHFILIGFGLVFIHARFQKNSWSLGENPAVMEEDEILFREALDLGLDQGDEIIRRRLIQKMGFFMDDMLNLDPPTEEELFAFWQADSSRFPIPARAAFTHLFFNSSTHGPKTSEKAKQILSLLEKGAISADAAMAESDPFLVESAQGAIEESEISKTFGADFASQIFQTEIGTWKGPITSPYGMHLVLITERQDAKSMHFLDAKRQVALELWDQKKQIAREAYMDELRKKYSVEKRPKEPAGNKVEPISSLNIQSKMDP